MTKHGRNSIIQANSDERASAMSTKNEASEMSAFRAYILNSAKGTKEKADSAAKKATDTVKNVKEGTKTTMTTVKKATEEAAKTTKTAAKAVKDTAETAKKTAATKATATKAAAKTAAKKTTDTAKKAAAKKPAAKKAAPKTTVELQFAGKNVSYDDLVKNAKDAFVNAGHKESEIKTIALYVKPEESMVYYVINDEQGSYAL